MTDNGHTRTTSLKPHFAHILPAIFALTSAPLMAQGVMDMPEGCSAFVTIQYSNCSVSHHYTCEADAPGEQWRVDVGEEGPYFLGKIDRETQWLESVDLILGIRDLLDADPKDPGSFTDLAQKGRDDFEFSTTSDAGEKMFYRGRDLLTGKTVVIDDVPLLQTETYARATNEDGEIVWESTGNEYIHLEWRVFLSGNYVTRTPEQTTQEESRPVSFEFPGEDGFLTDTPAHGCGAELL